MEGLAVPPPLSVQHSYLSNYATRFRLRRAPSSARYSVKILMLKSLTSIIIGVRLFNFSVGGFNQKKHRVSEPVTSFFGKIPH